MGGKWEGRMYLLNATEINVNPIRIFSFFLFPKFHKAGWQLWGNQETKQQVNEKVDKSICGLKTRPYG